MIAELRALLAKATPGPWVVEHASWDYGEPRVIAFRNAANDDIVEAGYDTDYYDGICDVHLKIKQGDAALIVEAVNNLATLIDVAEAAERQTCPHHAKDFMHVRAADCQWCAVQRALAKLGSK